MADAAHPTLPAPRVDDAQARPGRAPAGRDPSQHGHSFHDHAPHDHDPHSHAHGPHPHGGARPPYSPLITLMSRGIAPRLAMAAGAATLLWAVVFWALA